MTDQSSSLLKFKPQSAAIIAAFLTFFGALIGHIVSKQNTDTIADTDYRIKELEANNKHKLQKENQQHKITLDSQKFVRDIITKTLEKGTTQEQIKNLRAYAKIGIIGKPYNESLKKLKDEEFFSLETKNSEKIIGKITDSVTLRDLEKLQQISKSVGLINIRNSWTKVTVGSATGFLIGTGLLLMTDYTISDKKSAKHSTLSLDSLNSKTNTPTNEFPLTPNHLFITNKKLGYSLVAVARKSTNGIPISKYGYLKIKPYQGKILKGESFSLIHFPGAQTKQFIIRGGEFLKTKSDFIHYGIYTSPGSGGGVILNHRFEPLAIHRSSVPKRDEKGIPVRTSDRNDVLKVAKEGTLLTSILKDIQLKAKTLSPNARKRLNDLM